MYKSNILLLDKISQAKDVEFREERWCLRTGVRESHQTNSFVLECTYTIELWRWLCPSLGAIRDMTMKKSIISLKQNRTWKKVTKFGQITISTFEFR